MEATGLSEVLHVCASDLKSDRALSRFIGFAQGSAARTSFYFATLSAFIPNQSLQREVSQDSARMMFSIEET